MTDLFSPSVGLGLTETTQWKMHLMSPVFLGFLSAFPPDKHTFGFLPHFFLVMWNDESSRTTMAEDLTYQELGVPPRKEEESSTKVRSGTVRDDKCGSRTWLGRNDPRIVRASRSFGGKDRHSKVRTIKGLRDRRVRLSVPTAIQLYDLQDRLGFNQPSKVVDWLINATQHEIDKLPPLQMLESMEEDDGGGNGGGGIHPFPSPIQKPEVKSEQPNFFNLIMKDNNDNLGQRFEDVEGQKDASYSFSNSSSNGYLPVYLPTSSLSLMPASSQVIWTSAGTSSSFQQNGYDSPQNLFFGHPPPHFFTPFHPTTMYVASSPPSRPSK